MKLTGIEKGRILEALIYPSLVLAVMWLVFLVDRHLHLELFKYGVKPRSVEGIKGIFLMPFIHGQKDYSHILNNSVPIFILLSALIYFYRKIALYVILFIWIGGGFLLWYLAANIHTYHIGMSGVIYGLFGFLLLSGFLKKYLPLQAISLIVIFIYGSMIWGMFPTEERVSWEGHLSGFLVGLLLAVAFRKHGPVAPKFRYEIEQEMGIEPPNLEEEWKRQRQLFEEQQLKHQRENQELRRKLEELNRAEQPQNENTNVKNRTSSIENVDVNYHYTPKKPPQ